MRMIAGYRAGLYLILIAEIDSKMLSGSLSRGRGG